ncbi:Protease HtpX [Neobacillus rhizosphaerae]|uniref:Protease HtpX n=1 Tax=Neobacillus rhizosphaerae TaxID=2880965 RepID=A0ABN8KJZ2_9BACI|nr:M48 family metallopeptidase [Neobacillus rhizosphaerae]CAH2713160.1 Protease HtpX [Neobacillus rhizosphaerae]
MTKDQRELFQECPDCHANIPLHMGYISWCECGYNLHHKKEEKKKTRIEQLYEQLGEKSGQIIFNKMINIENLMPGISLVNGLALLIATFVHTLSLASFLFGMYLLFIHYFSFMSLFLGLLLVGIAWFTRPRVGKLEKGERIIPREEIPATYAVMDELADKMGLKKVDGIIINEKYNASILKIGWRRRTIVKIGVPLFAAFTPEEQCSIIAHELGHYLNKDLTYGFYIGTALSTLFDWYSLLDPVPSNQTFEYSLLDMVTNFFMKILAQIPFLFFWFLLHLVWNNSQKEEYLADYRAAQTCGSQDTVTALEKLHYDDIFYHSLSNVSLNDGAANVIDEFRSRLEDMPEREKKRYKLRCEREGFQLDATHPPTAFRIQFIEKQNLSGSFTIHPEKAKMMVAELDAMKEHIHEIAVEDYRYYWLN